MGCKDCVSYDLETNLVRQDCASGTATSVNISINNSRNHVNKSNLESTIIIDGPPGRPGSGCVNFIALTAVLWREFIYRNELFTVVIASKFIIGVSKSEFNLVFGLGIQNEQEFSTPRF